MNDYFIGWPPHYVGSPDDGARLRVKDWADMHYGYCQHSGKKAQVGDCDVCMRESYRRAMAQAWEEGADAVGEHADAMECAESDLHKWPEEFPKNPYKEAP